MKEDVALNEGFVSRYAKAIYWQISTQETEEDFPLGRPFGPPHLIDMNKITYRQAEIVSSMPGEFKKCNQTPEKFAHKFAILTGL